MKKLIKTAVLAASTLVASSAFADIVIFGDESADNGNYLQGMIDAGVPGGALPEATATGEGVLADTLSATNYAFQYELFKTLDVQVNDYVAGEVNASAQHVISTGTQVMTNAFRLYVEGDSELAIAQVEGLVAKINGSVSTLETNGADVLVVTPVSLDRSKFYNAYIAQYSTEATSGYCYNVGKGKNKERVCTEDVPAYDATPVVSEAATVLSGILTSGVSADQYSLDNVIDVTGDSAFWQGTLILTEAGYTVAASQIAQ